MYLPTYIDHHSLATLARISYYLIMVKSLTWQEEVTTETARVPSKTFHTVSTLATVCND